MSQVLPNRSRKRKIDISPGYILLIILVIIFCVRAVGVINSYRERGGFAYVQLLNFSMPIIETQAYNEDDYAENKLNIKRVVSEALGLSNITTYGIVGSEVTFFNSIKASNTGTKLPFSLFKPYELKQESIAKFTAEEIAELNSVSEAYDSSLKKTLNTAVPEVLIYHTHTTEAYSDVSGWTEEEDFSVVGVGNILADELQNGYGISVIHDKTNHYKTYNGCYDRSAATVKKYLEQYGDFKLIIDLHRDGTDNKDYVTVNLNGKNVARVMFVTAEVSERYQSNSKVANELAGITNRLFPGLLRNVPVTVYEYPYGIGGFNLGLSDNMALMEVGADINTAQEARLTAKYMARVIAEYINNAQ